MIRTLCLAALLAVCAPALLAAQEDEEFCPEGRTQLEMNICAGDELARADTLLNERYQRLLQAIEPHRVEPLRAAQRAWIRFRDAECGLEASEFQGGSMMPMVDTLCHAHLSRKRAEELERMLAMDR
jgi:uncharacterized protein YecT (DUF1311 family)